MKERGTLSPSLFLIIVMKKKQIILVMIISLFLENCASSGGLTKVNRYSETVGQASAFNFQNSAARLLDRYSYTINRYEEYSSRMYYETMWKDHSLFDDDIDIEIKAVQTRLTLEARPKLKEPTAGRETYSIKFIGEVLVRTDPFGEWIEMSMTPKRKTYFKQVADDFKFDLRASIRRF